MGMIAGAKRRHSSDLERSKLALERGRLEAALDDALENTFPASDPISMEQPASADHDRAKLGAKN